MVSYDKDIMHIISLEQAKEKEGKSNDILID